MDHDAAFSNWNKVIWKSVAFGRKFFGTRAMHVWTTITSPGCTKEMHPAWISCREYPLLSLPSKQMT